jgi:hypothetical protein
LGKESDTVLRLTNDEVATGIVLAPSILREDGWKRVIVSMPPTLGLSPMRKVVPKMFRATGGSEVRLSFSDNVLMPQLRNLDAFFTDHALLKPD